jgi:ABC-type sugar transport system permease subunit
VKKTPNIWIWPYLFCLPFIFAYCIFNLFPTFYSLYLSAFDWNGIKAKIFVGFGNYIRLWTRDPLFYKALKNTFIISAIAIPLQMGVGLLLAQFVFHLKRGKQVYQTIAFLPYIVAPVATGFIFAFIYDWQNGYMNTVLLTLGLIKEPIYWMQTPELAKLMVIHMVTWRMCGYCMVLYIAGMTSIPGELYEAAIVDGASSTQTFFKITLPQLRNISIFLMITGIITSLQMFDAPSMLYSSFGSGSMAVGGPDNSVLTVIWKFYDDAFKTRMQMGYGATVSYSLFVIIIALSLLSRKLTESREENE